MTAPAVLARRPHPCLEPLPARQMSRRGIALVLLIYAVLFAAGALHLWLSAGS